MHLADLNWLAVVVSAAMIVPSQALDIPASSQDLVVGMPRFVADERGYFRIVRVAVYGIRHVIVLVFMRILVSVIIVVMLISVIIVGMVISVIVVGVIIVVMVISMVIVVMLIAMIVVMPMFIRVHIAPEGPDLNASRSVDDIAPFASALYRFQQPLFKASAVDENDIRFRD